MASVSGAQASRTLHDIIPQYPKTKVDIGGGSVRLRSLVGIRSSQLSRFPKLEECAHFHYDHVDLRPIQLSLVEEELRGDGITLKVASGGDTWLITRSFDHFSKLDQQLHKCVFDRNFSELPVLSNLSPKSDEEKRRVLKEYVSRLSGIGSGCAISCGPALTWFELDNRGRRIVAPGQGINTPAVAAAFATTPYTASATDELSFQIGDMISVIDMPPAEESVWWRGKRGFVVGFFPSHCVAVITDKIPHEISLLAGPSKPVLRKHGKLIAFFRAFILSRPSRRRLKQSGILKERVFGCDLSEHLLNSAREIPLVLKYCAELIEEHGIVDGIYRLSGVTSNIQRLRSVFDEDRVPTLTEESNIRQDIHSVASLLKMYFRELPNPLCTYQLYDEFVGAVQSPVEQRVDKMRQTVRKLPPPHYRTLEYLMGHLSRVCGQSSGTGMTARNVAIVWAPNLLRCRSLDQGVAALQGVGVQAVVTEFLILYYPAIFQNQDMNGARPKSLAVSSPTKLLSLEEAQARGLHLRKGGEEGGAAGISGYHTVLELPTRKRPALNWKTIFTPRRSHQPKSPRRFNRVRSLTKTVIKSAEYLTVGSGGGGGGSHSRSVSHDSYFDTPEQPSLVESHYEGLSLSLDLSELQMNFDVEESEMRLFSEDETNQLQSSIGSLVSLEQRFSSQELRYIDSYSPEPSDSDTSPPRYQPLLTPGSYENLKVTNNTTSESQRTSASYAYEKLAESPGGHGGEMVKNELYEEMELEGYEPVAEGTPRSPHLPPADTNIYEDIQQLTPSEIYSQVSYFRSSVEELNRFVSESGYVEKVDSLCSSEKKDCLSIEDEDDKRGDGEVGVYHKIINSPEEHEKPLLSSSTPDTVLPNSGHLEDKPLDFTSETPLSRSSVPDVVICDKLIETLSGTNYENVDIIVSSSKTNKRACDNNEEYDQIKELSSTHHNDVECDNKLSFPVNELLDCTVKILESPKREVNSCKSENGSCSVSPELLGDEEKCLQREERDGEEDERLSIGEEAEGGVEEGGGELEESADRRSSERSRERQEDTHTGGEMQPLEEGGVRGEEEGGRSLVGGATRGKKVEEEEERRERIERYKEERRSYFRQKYGVGEESSDDDELIRRIKQRTQREPRSPTKTTVSISYSPARVHTSRGEEDET